MNPLYFGLVMFFAAFTKGLTGFGQALVAVPLLTAVVSVRVTSPLMSLFALFSNVYLLIVHRKALNWPEVWRLSLASLVGTPLGVWGLSALDERVVLGLLGIVLVSYSLYCLLGPKLPQIRNVNLAFPFGFVAGVLSGAYNTGGPPAVIYGNGRNWEPAEFKGNLQAFFMINSLMVSPSHLLHGNYAEEVLRLFLVALPFMIAGMLVGSRMDRYLDPARFRKVVLVVLVGLGLSLIF